MSLRFLERSFSLKVTGLITEYNPFHSGHQYHMDEARRLTGADAILVVMSGDFVQRGLPAITDKYSRTRMALTAGADAVIELPLAAATGSAEYFASGAVQTLNACGCVTDLVYGCECDPPELLTPIARLLSEEPDSFRATLLENLRSGLSYPAARSLAIQKILPDFGRILDLPNNILGNRIPESTDTDRISDPSPRAGPQRDRLSPVRQLHSGGGGGRQSGPDDRLPSRFCTKGTHDAASRGRPYAAAFISSPYTVHGRAYHIFRCVTGTCCPDSPRLPGNRPLGHPGSDSRKPKPNQNPYPARSDSHPDRTDQRRGPERTDSAPAARLPQRKPSAAGSERSRAATCCYQAGGCSGRCLLRRNPRGGYLPPGTAGAQRRTVSGRIPRWPCHPLNSSGIGE